jgi:hypothetical protein
MRLADLKTDHWKLFSAEESHRQNPDTFWIPPKAARENLKVGQAAKLLFEIEFVDEDGEADSQVERMWVIVSEIRFDFYIGILDNQPISVERSEDVYLCSGAEIPFKAEHVADIVNLPEEHVKWQLAQIPERIWKRD